MATHAEASSLSAATPESIEFCATLGALGIAPPRAARLFNVSARAIRRWQCGARRIPCGVAIVIRLLSVQALTLDQVEQAAVAIPARTNGGAKPGPPAPLLVAPAPEQSVLAPAEAAAPAEEGL